MSAGDLDGLEVGYDVPALPGMAAADVQTPALVLDLDALEANLDRMAAFAAEADVRLRPHAKMHRSADLARMQIERGAVGLCCQKVSEAEALVRGGVMDVLITNEVRDPAKLARLARLPDRGATVGVCVDDAAGVAELVAVGADLDVYVEVDIGAGRCGVTPEEAAPLAQAVADAPGLRFAGVQAYHGNLQHIADHAARAAAFEGAAQKARAAVEAIKAAGLAVPQVTGAGTGTYEFEARSGLWTELQAGSYAFMDADYAGVLDETGHGLGDRWQHALFVLTQVMSTAPGRAVCDAGLKAHAVDSGLPTIWGHDGLQFVGASDEHGEMRDPEGALSVGQKLRLVPGHCDPTCNLHDWYVGLRGGVVEAVWPVTARGKGF